MSDKILSEYAWMQIWGTKKGTRRLAYGGVLPKRKKLEEKLAEKPEPVPPGLLCVPESLTAEDLEECAPVTARPRSWLDWLK
jgi:hypothetical protein